MVVCEFGNRKSLAKWFSCMSPCYKGVDCAGSLSLVVVAFSPLLFVTCRTNELTLQIVDIPLVVKKVLLIVTLNLNATETFLGQVLWIVHVNDVVILALFAVLLGFDLIFDLILLEGLELALRQVVDINVALGLVFNLLFVITLDHMVLFQSSQLVDLVLNESV